MPAPAWTKPPLLAPFITAQSDGQNMRDSFAISRLPSRTSRTSPLKPRLPSHSHHALPFIPLPGRSTLYQVFDGWTGAPKRSSAMNRPIILLISQHAETRRLLEEATGSGLAVQTTHSMSDGLRLWKERYPALVICEGTFQQILPM